MKKLLSLGFIAMALASCAPQAENSAVKKEIPIQLYSVRNLIGNAEKYAENHVAVLDTLAKMGYTAVEAASYADGKLYGVEPEQFKADVEAAGLTVLSSHTTRALTQEELASGDFTEAMKWWDECIAAHKAAGMKYIVTPWAPVPDSMKDLQTYCEYHNAIGKKCAEAGMQYGYHSHAHEFTKVEDQEIMFDYMIQHTDPQYVFFEMDVYWAIIGKVSPVAYFKKYPGRFTLLHIKDEMEIGQSGMVGFDAIFNNFETAGAVNFVVEVERYSSEDVLKSVKESADYLINADFVKPCYQK